MLLSYIKSEGWDSVVFPDNHSEELTAYFIEQDQLSKHMVDDIQANLASHAYYIDKDVNHPYLMYSVGCKDIALVLIAGKAMIDSFWESVPANSLVVVRKYPTVSIDYTIESSNKIYINFRAAIIERK